MSNLTNKKTPSAGVENADVNNQTADIQTADNQTTDNQTTNNQTTNNQNGTAQNNGTDSNETSTKKPRVTFDRRMGTFRSALQLSRDQPRLKSFFESYGYGQEKLDEGLSLLQETVDADQAKKDKKNDQRTATRAFNKAWKIARRSLSFCISAARLAFRDSLETLGLLELKGKRRDTVFRGWGAHATVFYKKTLASVDMQTELAKYNVTAESLQAGQQYLTAAMTAENTKLNKKAEAESATRFKQAKYDRLMDWMRDYYQIVDVALKSYPELKEQLGIVVPYSFMRKKSSRKITPTQPAPSTP